MQKAVVVGAGIAGIAIAIRLALKKFKVEVYEANSYPGGKLSTFTQNNFRFDAGPSLLTMPQYINELFELAGKNPASFFHYQRLEETCRYFWEDKTQLTAWADPQKFAEEVALKTQTTVLELKKFFSHSRQLYDITHHVFLEQSLHQLKTYCQWSTLKSVLRLPQINAFQTMASANQRFFSDPKMVQFANRYATYNGSNPYQAPATLNVIPHLEQHFGAYFPVGGMHAITSKLVKLAEELGVTFHYQQPVEKIIIKRKQAVGVQVNQQMIPAHIVISNMDIYFTYQKLLQDQPQPTRILQQERSSSALIFYWGIKHQFLALGLHNILFSSDYKTEFEAIFKHKTIAKDPTVYLNISSKLKPDDAPTGCENWFTMINVPHNQDQQWDLLIAEAREAIIYKINKILNCDLKPLIVSESVLDPRGIELKTASYKGSLYGTSSNSQWAAFLRHANCSSTLGSLYFVGGSVHPGGGIPLALLSAKIVDHMIKSKCND